MPSKDLHEDPFDESTITKLEIFEDYVQAWIPTFVMQEAPIICIFDFFAGTGYDLNGIPGSPIRLLRKIKDHIGYIIEKSVRIRLYLNEYEPNRTKQNKYQLLQDACNEYLAINQDVKGSIDLIFTNKDFETLFPKLLSEIKQHPSLVYIDQNGIKFLSDKYLLEFEKMVQTDFLYFVSSSYFLWLGNTDEFKKHVTLDVDSLKKGSFSLVHRNLITQLKQKLPGKTKLKLYPFSIKKGTNIFGIVFGASHPLAVEKFLGIAWKRNEINGQANFDMDQDFRKAQLDLFGTKKLTKIEQFKENLKKRILSGEIRSNFDALNFAYEEGHIGRHAAETLKEMKQKGEINFTATSPYITYDKVYRERQLVDFNLPK
ncbi:three-Cys-motif partner protein TcmP [Dyadobacter arcticus]|uniref:Three-Cys-motif partner protein n=1 Tax=Dyadobacter arcticus TaxID=1078754 RepID=A0ABX0UEM0_9BACT|nr:three-Cys-motif partner protein TcmP [Dyadobacter arcticus]NIJ51443.1 three-Cys-motif partner protein [Dyadobacter arcticus]